MFQVFWEYPPVGVLKLHFDGSFVKPNWGGIGGVTRDCNNILLRSYSGPVISLNANESEVFSLLVRCCELRRLVGSKAIIEGDSFSAI